MPYPPKPASLTFKSIFIKLEHHDRCPRTIFLICPLYATYSNAWQPSVKTLRPLSDNFQLWGHCVEWWNSTLAFALLAETEIFDFLERESNSQPIAFTVACL